jgi:hypothetical protein
MAEAWPIDVRSPEELPAPLAARLAGQLEQGETVRKRIWVPADPGPLSRAGRTSGLWMLTRGDQVLAATDRRLIVGTDAAAEETSRWLAIPYVGVLAWALTEALLYGRVDVCAELSGSLVKASVEFNTVGRWMVEEALLPLKAAALGIDARPASGPSREGPGPPGLPMKFVSFLRHELLAGEWPVGSVFEERRIQRFLGLWPRLARPAQLIATTDLRLLVIREEPGVEEARYGYTTASLPRRRLGDVVIVDEGPSLAVRHGADVAVLGPP